MYNETLLIVQEDYRQRKTYANYVKKIRLSIITNTESMFVYTLSPIFS
jgi:hypothetical protein